MSQNPAGSAPEARPVQRGQLWLTTENAKVLIFGITSRTAQIVAYVYGENTTVRLGAGDLAELLQDVCVPRCAEDFPVIKAVGNFSWNAQEGFQQLPKDFTSDSGATTLVRMEDAVMAVNAALEMRDTAIAAMQGLKEAADLFQQAFEHAHPSR